MRMGRIALAIAFIVVNLVILLGVLFYVVPWQSMLEDHASQVMKQNGLPNAKLEIAFVGLSETRIQNVTFGDEKDPFSINSLQAKYNLQEIRQGRVEEIVISEMPVTLKQEGDDAQWTLRGWTDLLKAEKGKEGTEAKSFSPPVTSEYKSNIPVEKIRLQESALTLITPSFGLNLPLNLTWQKSDNPDLLLEKSDLKINAGEYNISAAAQMTAALNEAEEKWTGKWALENLNVRQRQQKFLPVANLSGAAEMTRQALTVRGSFTDETQNFTGDFTYTYPFDPENPPEDLKNSITLRDTVFRVVQDKNGWRMDGLPQSEKESQQPFIPPVTPEYKAAIPFETATVKDGLLSVTAPAWTMVMPVNLQWRKDAKKEISLTPTTMEIEAGDLGITGKLEADATLNAEKRRWEADWNIQNLILSQKGTDDYPPATINGSATADESALRVTGKIKGKENAYSGAFRYVMPFKTPEKTHLILTNFSMPWQGGTVSTDNMTIPLREKAAYKFTLKVDKASVGSLMREFTGEYVQATGTISGNLPVTIKADGTVSIGQSTLTADEEGTISMPPELIPGDTAQMKLTRDILGKFNYKKLSLTTQERENGGLDMKVRLEGNNPKVQDGRPVILTVNLTGDLLDFITSSVMIFTSPQTIIKQGQK